MNARTSTLARLLFVTILAGCGGSGYGSAPTAPTTTGITSNAITVADNSFTPNATTVAPGTTVTWSWRGRRQHNVTFDDGTKSSTQSSGTFQRTLHDPRRRDVRHRHGEVAVK